MKYLQQDLTTFLAVIGLKHILTTTPQISLEYAQTHTHTHTHTQKRLCRLRRISSSNSFDYLSEIFADSLFKSQILEKTERSMRWGTGRFTLSACFQSLSFPLPQHSNEKETNCSTAMPVPRSISGKTSLSLNIWRISLVAFSMKVIWQCFYSTIVQTICAL